MYVDILVLLVAVAVLVLIVFVRKVSVAQAKLQDDIRRSHESLTHEIGRLRSETKEEREERERNEAERRRREKEEAEKREKERKELVKRETEARQHESNRDYEDDDDDGYECEVGGPSCCGRGQGPYYC